MRPLSLFAACALLTLLAACGGGKDENDERTASGQVLEGTISDSMLPLETVRSQPPLAKVTGTPGEGAEATGTPDPDATATPTGDETPAVEQGDAPNEG